MTVNVAATLAVTVTVAGTVTVAWPLHGRESGCDGHSQ